MTDMSIRLATYADVDAVAALFDAYRQFYEQTADSALARNFISERIQNNESAILFALGENDMALGFCQLYPTFCSVEAAPIYVLYDLFVAPVARGLGVGRTLLRAAEDHAVSKGMARMDLSTARTNRSAQTLYESLGWVRDDVFFSYSRQLKKES